MAKEVTLADLTNEGSGEQAGPIQDLTIGGLANADAASTAVTVQANPAGLDDQIARLSDADRKQIEQTRYRIVICQGCAAVHVHVRRRCARQGALQGHRSDG